MEPTFANERATKQKISVSLGSVDFYSKTKIKTITSVVRRFYENWDEELYQSYIKRFDIDENKRPAELSDSGGIKCSLALSLSHHATL
ncbi:MAG: hypothetical protein R2881_11230 [Eubacteriales bacterium]